MTTTTKITNRDRYNTLEEIVRDYFNEGTMSEEEFEDIITFLHKQIEMLDKKAAKAKETAAAKKAEKDDLCEAVEAVLTNEYQTRNDVFAQIEFEGAKIAQVGYRLSKLVALGIAEKSEISVPDEDGKKTRKAMAYKLA